MKSLFIGIDFDGTVVTHKYPEIGEEVELELLNGGFIGLGKIRKQRLSLPLELAGLYPEEETINILCPVPGTP